MKKGLLVLACLFITQAAFSQAEVIGLNYILKGDVGLNECDIKGTNTQVGGVDVVTLAPGGSKFSIVDIKDDVYIIRFWVWKIPDATEVNNLKGLAVGKATLPEKNKLENIDHYENLNFTTLAGVVPAAANLRYFKISGNALKMFATELTARLEPAYGVLSMPFRLRGDHTFSKDFTFANVGALKFYPYKYKRDFSIDFLLGVGISSVTVDSSNTYGNVKESSERAAITIPIGVVLDFKGIQLGVTFGWDMLSKGNINNWQYQGKTWFALGIGYSIFSAENKNTKEGKN